jgi:hypothetical protein
VEVAEFKAGNLKVSVSRSKIKNRRGRKNRKKYKLVFQVTNLKELVDMGIADRAIMEVKFFKKGRKRRRLVVKTVKLSSGGVSMLKVPRGKIDGRLCLDRSDTGGILKCDATKRM